MNFETQLFGSRAGVINMHYVYVGLYMIQLGMLMVIYYSCHLNTILHDADLIRNY